MNWHCSNEHFTVEEFIRANCEYPGDWEGEVEKTVNGVTHFYHLAGTQILSEEWTDADDVQRLIVYHYDANGQPVGMS